MKRVGSSLRMLSREPIKHSRSIKPVSSMIMSGDSIVKCVRVSPRASM